MAGDSEPPGVAVHQVAVAWAAEHDLDVPCYKPWDLLTDDEREVFARMASATGVRAIHDAEINLAAKETEIRRLRHRKWAEEWAREGRDRDGNLILKHLESGGLYRVLPVEET